MNQVPGIASQASAPRMSLWVRAAIVLAVMVLAPACMLLGFGHMSITTGGLRLESIDFRKAEEEGSVQLAPHAVPEGDEPCKIEVLRAVWHEQTTIVDLAVSSTATEVARISVDLPRTRLNVVKRRRASSARFRVGEGPMTTGPFGVLVQRGSESSGTRLPPGLMMLNPQVLPADDGEAEEALRHFGLLYGLENWRATEGLEPVELALGESVTLGFRFYTNYIQEATLHLYLQEEGADGLQEVTLTFKFDRSQVHQL